MNLAALQRVIGRQNRAARIPENSLHPFALNAFPQDAGAAHSFRCLVRHTSFLRSKKQNPPSQLLGGGIRELSKFPVSQLAVYLHTATGTATRTPRTTF